MCTGRSQGEAAGQWGVASRGQASARMALKDAALHAGVPPDCHSPCILDDTFGIFGRLNPLLVLSQLRVEGEDREFE